MEENISLFLFGVSPWLPRPVRRFMVKVRLVTGDRTPPGLGYRLRPQGSREHGRDRAAAAAGRPGLNSLSNFSISIVQNTVLESVSKRAEKKS